MGAYPQKAQGSVPVTSGQESWSNENGKPWHAVRLAGCPCLYVCLQKTVSEFLIQRVKGQMSPRQDKELRLRAQSL